VELRRLQLSHTNEDGILPYVPSAIGSVVTVGRACIPFSPSCGIYLPLSPVEQDDPVHTISNARFLMTDHARDALYQVAEAAVDIRSKKCTEEIEKHAYRGWFLTFR